MIDVIPDLWPTDLEVKQVVTPLAILRSQAEKLRQNTNGILLAELNSYRQDKEIPWLVHHFEIIAPAMSGYRFRLFSVEHASEQVYPAFVVAPYVATQPQQAADQKAFIEEIKRVLASPKARSVIHSLIAQSNEALSKAEAS